VERFGLQDASGGIWAVRRENTSKLQLIVRSNASHLSHDYRPYLFSPDGQQLSLHPQCDAGAVLDKLRPRLRVKEAQPQPPL
jgi:hypothetical protein